MLRSACFAAGLFVGLWGLSFLAIDKLVMFQPEERDPGIRGMLARQVVNKETRPIIDPPDWAAFTLLSIGSVTMLYAVALPNHKTAELTLVHVKDNVAQVKVKLPPDARLKAVLPPMLFSVLPWFTTTS